MVESNSASFTVAKLLLVMGVLLICTSLVWLFFDRTERPPPQGIADYLFWEPKELTDFTLVGADNKEITLAELQGKWSFIYFGYTSCPDVCPVTLQSLASAFKLLEQQGQSLTDVQGIFISVDASRDTPEKLKEFIDYFGSGFISATGNKAQLDDFLKQMGTVYFSDPTETGENYAVSHNSTLFLLDPQVRKYARFPIPHIAKEIADTFVEIRTHYDKNVNNAWQLFSVN